MYGKQSREKGDLQQGGGKSVGHVRNLEYCRPREFMGNSENASSGNMDPEVTTP